MFARGAKSNLKQSRVRCDRSKVFCAMSLPDFGEMRDNVENTYDDL